MSFVSKIQAVLGADTADFKAKMEDAGMAAEKFDKQVKKFGLGFGGVAAIVTAFRAIVDYARDLENPMDANLKRAHEFAKGLDGVKSGMLEIGAKALGVVNSIGEWGGRLAAVAMYGEKQVAQGEAIAKQAEETIKAIERDKPLTAEIARLNKETLATKEKIREETDKQLSVEDKLIAAARDHQAALDQLARSAGDKKATAEATLDVARKELEYVKAFAEAQKERQKKEEEAAKKRREDADAEFELRQQMLDEDQKIKEKGAAKEIEKRQALLELEKQASAEAARQVEIAKEKADETERWARGLARGFSTLSVSGNGTATLSNRELDAKIANLSRQISEMQASDRVGGFALSGADPTGLTSVLQAELEKAKGEADVRRRFAQTRSFFGEDAAFKLAGSEENFERLLSKIAQPDLQTRTAKGIEELNKRLDAFGMYPNR